MTQAFGQEDFEAFLEEAEQHAATLEQGALALEAPGQANGDDGAAFAETVAGMFRSAQSIKGAAGLLGLGPLARLTHALESVLGRVRERRLEWSPDCAEAALAAIDSLRSLLAAGPAGAQGEAAAAARAAERALEELLDAEARKHSGDRTSGAPVARPGSGAQAGPGLESGPQGRPGSLANLGLDPAFEGLLGPRERELLGLLGPERRYLYELRLVLDACAWLNGQIEHPALERLRALGHLFALLTGPPAPLPDDILGPFRLESRALFVSTAEPALLEMLVPLTGSWLATRFDPTRSGDPGEGAGVRAEGTSEGAVQRPARRPAPPEAIGDSASGDGALRDDAAEAAAPDEPKDGIPEAAPAGPAMPGRQASIRVGVERLDLLIEVVGELLIGQNRIMSLGAGIARRHDRDPDVDLLNAALERMARLLGDLQTVSMGMRMVPLERIFNLFPRQIRDLGRTLDKVIRLEIGGADTELDRQLVEALEAPLVHLLRNAADHGIESPQERVRQGKPECGTIRLSAGREGNRIVIRVADDGRGIDPARVLKKARALGMTAAGTGGGPQAESEADILQLLLQPGFSTAEQVSTVSGRGVGLDVVARNIRTLKGTVEVTSRPGAGATFTLRMPLTLAITKALLVGAGGATFAIPVDVVRENIRLAPQDFRTLNGHEVVHLREKVVPVVRLTRLFGLPEQTLSGRGVPTVVVEPGGQPFGLVVDALEGEQDIVIKPLGELLAAIEGLTGGAILGDGRIALVLDAATIAGVVA